MTVIMCPICNGECMYSQCEFWDNGCLIKMAVRRLIGVPEPVKEETKVAKRTKK